LPTGLRDILFLPKKKLFTHPRQ